MAAFSDWSVSTTTCLHNPFICCPVLSWVCDSTPLTEHFKPCPEVAWKSLHTPSIFPSRTYTMINLLMIMYQVIWLLMVDSIAESLYISRVAGQPYQPTFAITHDPLCNSLESWQYYATRNSKPIYFIYNRHSSLLLILCSSTTTQVTCLHNS